MLAVLRSRMFASALPLAFLMGCNDSGPLPTSPETVSNVADPYISQLIALGFRSDQIEKRGDGYIVEEDIEISLPALKEMVDRQASVPFAQGYSQYRHTNLVTTPGLIYDVTVDLSGLNTSTTMGLRRYNAMVAAIGHWNALPTSYVRFLIATPGHITVTEEDMWRINHPVGPDVNTAAVAAYPVNGVPGSTLKFNINFRVNGQEATYAMLVRTAAHELGHNVGIRHTNFMSVDDCRFTVCTDFVHIPGTPSSKTNSADPASVFNGGQAGTNWNGFSNNDKTAITKLYGLPYPNVSVTYPGAGHPVFSWTALPNVTSVTMSRCREIIGYHYEYGSWGWSDCVPLGTTSGTTLTDSGISYTGIDGWYCDFSTQEESVYRHNYYALQVTYSNGKTVGMSHSADVFTCNSLWEW